MAAITKSTNLFPSELVTDVFSKVKVILPWLNFPGRHRFRLQE